MARRKGDRYPSDHRRYFRVAEDILDDPKLQECSADVFRFYLNLLAMLNRTKSREGVITLSSRALCLCAARERPRHALAIARSVALAGLATLSSEDGHAVLTVSKWAEFQELPQRDPDETPLPTPTPVPTPTPIPKKKERLAADAAPSKGKHLCPEKLSEEDLGKLTNYAAKVIVQEGWRDRPGHWEARVEHAIETVHEWSTENIKKRTAWLATCKRALREQWGADDLKGRLGAIDRAAYEERQRLDVPRHDFKLTETPDPNDPAWNMINRPPPVHAPGFEEMMAEIEGKGDDESGA